jgi:dihydropteroate synthase
LQTETLSLEPRARLKALLETARRGERTLVMGVLNVTPDSFSDGGRFFAPSAAIAQAERMAEEGADILDIGGESTRPGSDPVPAEEELARILPVIEAVSARLPIPISVDTYKATVARRAVEAGAAMVNDISAMTFDPEMAPTLAALQVPVCLMHIQGNPKTMQQNPVYADVAAEVRDWLAERAQAAVRAGIAPENILLDPGFGFGKTAAHNLELVRRLRELTALGYPLLLGVSRKSTIGRVLGGLPAEDRLEGTAAAVAICIANGASVVRVHDVKAMTRVVRMTDALVRGNWTEDSH